MLLYVHNTAALAAILEAARHMNSRITDLVGHYSVQWSIKGNYLRSWFAYLHIIMIQESQALVMRIQQRFAGKDNLVAPGRVITQYIKAEAL